MTCSVNIMLLLRLSSLPVYASRPYSAASRQLQQLHSIMQTAADAANRSTQITEFAQRQLDEDIIDFSAGQVCCEGCSLQMGAAPSVVLCRKHQHAVLADATLYQSI